MHPIAPLPHRHFFGSLLGFTVLIHTAAAGTDSTPDAAPNPMQRAFIDSHPARQLYLESCAGCHGRYLQGGSATSFLDETWAHGSEPEQIERSIVNGYKTSGMPSFAPAFDAEQRKALVDLLRNARAGHSELNPSPGAHETSAPQSTPRNQLKDLKTRDYNIRVEVLVDHDLKTPWSIDFFDPHVALVTEKPGRLRWLIDGQLDSQAIEGIPAVRDRGQGGLMDVAFDPEYGDGANDWVYLAYADGKEDNDLGMTKIVRGQIDGHRWTQQQVLFEARPEDYLKGNVHFGGRLAFDSDGHLFFTIGERGQRDNAQRLDKPNGKVHRINRDGSIPSSNPFIHAQRDGEGPAYSSIYSLGHRNPQGLVFDTETNTLWETEHGPRGGDELNLIAAGKNYGWPLITYGINYNGTLITEEFEREGLEQPVLYWEPSIAACGLDIYHAGPFERWKGQLFVGGLAHEVVRRLVMDDDHVIHQEIILERMGRVRDVCCAPDGSIYVVHNSPDRIIRLTPISRTVQP